MPACWTCGSPVASFSHTCPSCASLKGLTDLKGQVQLQGLATSFGLAQLARVQAKGFEQLQATMAKGLAQLADVIEWGFNELGWRIQEQTDILKDIDHTLKTPTQTRGNEYRTMADELTKRGEYEQADGLYRKSLGLNPLDYRTYVGFAEALLRSNRPTEAREVLLKSLPHAPKQEYEGRLEHGASVISDWRSYSLRLIGHIDACEGEYAQATASLRSAVELSPFYAEALYDYAQYTARLGEGPASMSSLKRAITLNSLYWYLPHRQRAFAPVKDDLKHLLTALRGAALDRADHAIEMCEQTATAFGSMVTAYKQEFERAAMRHKFSSWERERARLALMEKKRRECTDRLESMRARCDAKDYTTLLTVPVEADNLGRDVQDHQAGAAQNLTALRASAYQKRRMQLFLAVTIPAVALVLGCICYSVYSNQRDIAAQQARQEKDRLEAEEVARKKVEAEAREDLRRKEEEARRDGFLDRFTVAAKAKGWEIGICDTDDYSAGTENAYRGYTTTVERADLKPMWLTVVHHYTYKDKSLLTDFCVYDAGGAGGDPPLMELSYKNWNYNPGMSKLFQPSSPELNTAVAHWQRMIPELLDLLKQSW